MKPTNKQNEQMKPNKQTRKTMKPTNKPKWNQHMNKPRKPTNKRRCITGRAWRPARGRPSTMRVKQRLGYFSHFNRARHVLGPLRHNKKFALTVGTINAGGFGRTARASTGSKQRKLPGTTTQPSSIVTRRDCESSSSCEEGEWDRCKASWHGNGE